MNIRITRQTIPWLHRWARPVMAAIASIGIAVTTYLTVTKLSGNPLACPGNECDKVLSSAYSTIAGIPLAFLGFLAYLCVLILAIAPLLNGHRRAEQWQRLDRITWRFLFAQTTAMATFNSYMLYIMITAGQVFAQLWAPSF